MLLAVRSRPSGEKVVFFLGKRSVKKGLFFSKKKKIPKKVVFFSGLVAQGGTLRRLLLLEFFGFLPTKMPFFFAKRRREKEIPGRVVKIAVNNVLDTSSIPARQSGSNQG